MPSKLYNALGKYAVFFTKTNPDTGDVYEAGSVLFNTLNGAKTFMNGFKEYPYTDARLYTTIGVDYEEERSINIDDYFRHSSQN